MKLNLTKKDIQSGGWIAPEIYRRDWLTLFRQRQQLEKELTRLHTAISGAMEEMRTNMKVMLEIGDDDWYKGRAVGVGECLATLRKHLGESHDPK